MTPSAAPYGTGQTITYNIVVTNGGVVPANNVSVTDTLPAGTALLSAVASQGSCGGAPAITCSLGTLAAGGSATVTLQLTLPSTPGNVANTANVSTSNPDPNNANDSVTVAVNVIPAAQLPATSALLLLLLAFALIAIAFLRH